MAMTFRVTAVVLMATMAGPSPSAKAEQPGTQSASEQIAKPVGDFYGDFLPAGAVQRLGTIRFQAGARLSSMVLSPDGTLLAGGTGFDVFVWEMSTGRLLQRLRHENYAGVAFIAPDNHTVFTYSPGAGLFTWDLASGKRRHLIDLANVSLSAFDLSPDGTFIALYLTVASGKYEDNVEQHFKWIELRDAKTGKVIRTFAESESQEFPTALRFAADGKTLVCLRRSKENLSELARWNPATGQLQSVLAFDRLVSQHHFSRDLKRIAFHGVNRIGAHSLEIWDLEVGKPILPKLPQPAWHQMRGLTPDGKGILLQPPSGFTPETGLIANFNCFAWDFEKGVVLCKFEGPINASLGLFAPDGKSFIQSNTIGAVERWDIATGKRLPGPGGHETAVRSLAWSPDCRLIASCATNEPARLWDTASGRELDSIESQDWTNVQFAGRFLIVSGNAGMALFDIKTGREKRLPFQPNSRAVRAVAVSGDGKLLAAITHEALPHPNAVPSDCTLKVWHFPSMSKLITSKIPFTPGTALAFSPGKYQLAMVKLPPPVDVVDFIRTGVRPTGEGAIVIWNIPNGQIASQISTAHLPVQRLFYSQDGHTMIGGDPAGNIYRWNLKSKQQLPAAIPTSIIDSAGTIDISPNGKLIAVCNGRDKDFWLLDAVTDKVLCRVQGHLGNVTSVAFSADNRYIASGSTDTTILIWDVRALRREKSN